MFLWVVFVGDEDGKDIGCGSLDVRDIGFNSSYDTAALLFWRVHHFLFFTR